MTFRNIEVELIKENYITNKNIALMLVEKETNELILVCTVNIDNLKENEIAIKDYSENEGMLNWLLENEIVEKPHRFEQSGFVILPICYLKEVLK